MKNKAITIDEFVKAESEDMKKFLKWWKANQKKFSENFPGKMGYSDWAEQFNNYQGMEDR
jgi:hypothetical protein